VARTNWAGNYAYGARVVHRPETIEQLQEIVASARRLHVLGSRHSFTDIADSLVHVTLEALPIEAVAVDRDAGTVTVAGPVTYAQLASVLNGEGLALANLASLPHISIAGAVATATHGSGVRNRNLAAAVRAIELVTSDGELFSVGRGDPDFEGMVVGLGATGVVLRLTLDVESGYEVAQRVFERLSWDAFCEHFDEVMASGYSVSAFTLWGDAVDQVWVKSRGEPPAELFDAAPATADVHPIPGLDPVNCTAQMGVPGPWSERLPHFRSGFTPSSGEEIQSEYLVPRPRALEALEALRALAATVTPLLQISEIRTVAADSLWMSPQYGRDTVGFHFTWVRRQAGVERALRVIEAALLPLGARPHWGKLFLAGADVVAPRYGRLSDFRALLERLDPRGAFRNSWLERRVLRRSGRS
jgi:alditol oxidase